MRRCRDDRRCPDWTGPLGGQLGPQLFGHWLMEDEVPKTLQEALHAIADRAAMGVRTWQRLLEFIALRATAEEEYALALSRAQGVWSTQKRRAFFSRDAGQAAGACLASAGQVGSLRDGLATVVDVESERVRQLAADRAVALRELCVGADTKVDDVDRDVQELRQRADLLL
eukprot:COSAG02_NODE_10222_length_1992_cov_3.477021_1_plen_170_part_10